MKTMFNWSIKMMSADTDIKYLPTKNLATFLIILSGFILYLDKIFTFFDIKVENLHGWSSQESYIWSLCQTISPVLIMAGMYLRPYPVALVVPVFCYCLQFYFVMNSNLTIDRPLTWLYVSGTTVLVLLVIQQIKRLGRRYVEREIARAKANIQKNRSHEE